MVATVCLRASKTESSVASHSPRRRDIRVAFFFLVKMVVILISTLWYQIVVSNYIYLRFGDAENLYLCLFALHASSLVKRICSNLLHISKHFLRFGSLYIFGIEGLYQQCVYQIFSSLCGFFH